VAVFIDVIVQVGDKVRVEVKVSVWLEVKVDVGL
jgi:hypothetical protein